MANGSGASGFKITIQKNRFKNSFFGHKSQNAIFIRLK